MAHTLLAGKTGAGKNELMNRWIVASARKKDRAVIFFTSQRKGANRLMLFLDRYGFTPRLWIEQYAENDRTLGRRWVRPATAGDEWQRRALNEKARNELKNIIFSRRKMQTTALTPILDRGANAHLDLLYYQLHWCPEPWVIRGAERDSDESRYLLPSCTNGAIVRVFEEWWGLPRRDQLMEVRPIVRAFEPFFLNTSLMARCRQDDVIDELIARNMILIFDFSGMDLDMGPTIAKADLRRVMNHFRDGGSGAADIYVDEGERHGFADANFVDDLSLSRQWGRGVNITIAVQNPLGLGEHRSSIWENTDHVFGRLSDPNAADMAAEEIATRIFDPLKVLYTDQVIQQVHAGYDLVKTKSRGESKSDDDTRKQSGESEHHLSRYTQNVNKTRHVESFESQKKQVKKKLMGSDPQMAGRFYFSTDAGITPEPVYIPMLPEPRSWSLPATLHPRVLHSEKRISDIVALIKARPEYQPPRYLLPPSSSTTSAPPLVSRVLTSAGSGMSP